MAQPPAGARPAGSVEGTRWAAGGGGRGRGPARPVLSVTSTAWPDGGEIPMHNAGAQGGDNKSPAFEFHWNLGTMPTDAPATLKTYAVILHDVENVGPMNSTTDIAPLDCGVQYSWNCWQALAEGLGAGTLADGTTNGPGIRGGAMGAGFWTCHAIYIPPTFSSSTRWIRSGANGNCHSRRIDEGDGRSPASARRRTAQCFHRASSSITDHREFK